MGGTAPRATSAAEVDAHLEPMRAALEPKGGGVKVTDVQQGTCVLRFRGPPAMGDGIASAVRATFHDINEVITVPL